MPAHGNTRADKIKAERIAQYRDYLSNKCRLEHVIRNIEKIESLTLDDKEFQQLAKANDQRLKLINKYCPDMKDDQTLTMGNEDGKFVISWSND